MTYNNPPEGISQASSSTNPSSTMALISLVAGILGLTALPTIGSIVALVTGYIAKKEIRESGGVMGGGGMATAGLIMGWIGVAILLIGICAACVIFALIPLGIIKYSTETFLPGMLVAFF